MSGKPPENKSLRDTIHEQILNGFWKDLKEHLLRDAVFLVSSELDLADVAFKVAEDDAQAVADWINKGKIARPTAAMVKLWDSEEGKFFRFVIVAPYVLIQESAH